MELNGLIKLLEQMTIGDIEPFLREVRKNVEGLSDTQGFEVGGINISYTMLQEAEERAERLRR